MNISKIIAVFVLIIVNEKRIVSSLTLSSNGGDESVVELTRQDGSISVPLINSNSNQTLKWLIKAQIGNTISVFLEYYNLFGCIDNEKYEYLKIGPVVEAGDNYFNSCLINSEYENKTYSKLNSINNQLSIEYKRSNINLNSKIAFELVYRIYSNKPACDENEFRCESSNRCIKNSYKCDCYNDCSDFEDELSCRDDDINCNKLEIDLNQVNCSENEIFCLDSMSRKGTCKSTNIICDGNNDCYNNVDEINCMSANIMTNDDDDNTKCVNVYKTDNYGSLSSPNFPNIYNYTNGGLNCSYHIIVEPYEKIQIRIKKFKLRPYYLTTTLGGGIQKSSIFDFDYLSIYDGDTIFSPLIANLNSQQNNNELNNKQKIFNSKSNSVLIIFHASSTSTAATNNRLNADSMQYFGFNLTFQVKGLCIDDQQSCSSFNSKNELNCFDKEQRCDDNWDCNSGADEVDCGGDICSAGQYKCRNRLSCYKYEDRCDGEHQCIDKSDENNCNSWFCNSDNGTFLCSNKHCIYEQWVCDGTNDCDDGSDEINCPTPFTRRVITTAVLGGTLCLLLLVMALGCACKLYTLRTVDYRTSLRSRRRRERAAAANRRSFSLFNLLRRNRQNNSPTTPTSANSQPGSTATTNNNIYRLARSASMSSLDYQNLVAPPTYNQTMGLVDEYEQRQLAFIEHVRSMINNSNAAVASSTSNTPSSNNQPASSSSRSHRRRSHSARHSSPRVPATIAADLSLTPATVINLNDQTIQSLSSRHHRRRHRHHRQPGHHHYHHHHHHHHHEANNNNSRRPPIIAQSAATGGPTSNRLQDNNAGNSQEVSKQTTSNLKDRLAKLIKDIVNHGDNIQYVQLGDSTAAPPTRSLQNSQLEQQQSLETNAIPLESRNNERDSDKLIDS